MLVEEVVAYEMNAKEKYLFEHTKSLVTKVKKIEIDKTIKDKKVIIEGLLYVVGEDGLKPEQIAMTLDISYEKAIEYLNEIKNRYDSNEYGIELTNFGGVYKFLTKVSIHEYISKLFNLVKSNSLSQSALETLAIIAYKQPITRLEIEDLRGVGSDMMLRKLEAKGLIQEVGRSEAPGRPILYSVTDEFMDSFKLETLNDLPSLDIYENNEVENLFND